jgi:hypothetical protein
MDLPAERGVLPSSLESKAERFWVSEGRKPLLLVEELVPLPVPSSSPSRAGSYRPRMRFEATSVPSGRSSVRKAASSLGTGTPAEREVIPWPELPQGIRRPTDVNLHSIRHAHVMKLSLGCFSVRHIRLGCIDSSLCGTEG